MIGINNKESPIKIAVNTHNVLAPNAIFPPGRFGKGNKFQTIIQVAIVTPFFMDNSENIDNKINNANNPENAILASSIWVRFLHLWPNREVEESNENIDVKKNFPDDARAENIARITPRGILRIGFGTSFLSIVADLLNQNLEMYASRNSTFDS
mgnify:CR=1 FL=1